MITVFQMQLSGDSLTQNSSLWFRHIQVLILSQVFCLRLWKKEIYRKGLFIVSDVASEVHSQEKTLTIGNLRTANITLPMG